MTRPDAVAIGDEVSDSPVGGGRVTDITQADYPQVNRVAVAWLKRPDGAVFDPWGHVGGSKPAQITPVPAYFAANN